MTGGHGADAVSASPGAAASLGIAPVHRRGADIASEDHGLERGESHRESLQVRTRDPG